MDQFVKKTLFAVAGSGKTSQLIAELTTSKRTLLLTYTENNYKNLLNLVKIKFGYIPDNILVCTYFSFLYSFCIKPFIIGSNIKTTGLFFEEAPRFAKGLKRYITANGRVFHSRALALIDQYIGFQKVSARLAKFFDCILIDEVQDFAGYDFDFIELVGNTACDSIFVGDFYQHTFNTSNDGSKNNNLHADYNKYKARFQCFSEVDEISLSGCHRCSEAVCDFVRLNLGIKISSLRLDYQGEILILNDESDIIKIMNADNVKKLFFRNSLKYSCNASNWGDCKGLSFEDVCVVLNKTTFTNFSNGRLNELAPQTKNKFYVACTRSKGKLFFVEERRVQGFMVK